MRLIRTVLPSAYVTTKVEPSWACAFTVTGSWVRAVNNVPGTTTVDRSYMRRRPIASQWCRARPRCARRGPA